MTRMQPDLPVRVKRENADVDPNPGRRRVLAQLIASMFLSPLAHALPSVAASTPGENFMALSLFATGRSKLRCGDSAPGGVYARLFDRLRSSAGSAGPPDAELRKEGSAGHSSPRRHIQHRRLCAQGRRQSSTDAPAYREPAGSYEVKITDQYNANNHVIVGTIMGRDPNDSVVDADCRTHNHENLYIAGGAAMPSASCINSTLSMVALSLVMAEKLKQSTNS